MIEYALHLEKYAEWIARVTFGNIEINLYRYNGKNIEVWFNTKKDRIEELHFINGAPFNPYLKFVNPLCQN